MSARPDRRHHGGEDLIDGRIELLTPEGVRLSLVPAGPGRRAFAWGVDFCVVLAVLFLAALVLMKSEAGQGLFLIVLFLMWWGYPVLFEVFAKGMTPGKRWLGLQVVRADGLPVGWRESILRNVLLVADFLPMLYGTGIVCMSLDARFRRVGDIVADTLVIHRPGPGKPGAPGTDRIAANFGAPERKESAVPTALPFALLPGEQRALLDLLERAPDLSPARLSELGDLAEPLTGTRGATSIERLRAIATGLLE